jgi:hypothetical protein
LSGSAGGTLAPVRVAVLDRAGRLWSGVNVRLVLIRKAAAPHGRSQAVRVLQARTVDGVATFNGISIGRPGNYVLRAAIGRQRVDSDAFTVGPRPPAGRAVWQRPTGSFRPAPGIRR